MVKNGMGDPQESSRERKHEHVEAVNDILDSVDPALEEHAYPVDREELSARYGETTIELPNETESLGDVFDRLSDDEYDSPMAVKEAVLDSVSAATPDPPVSGGNREPAPGAQGTPREGLDDLESADVAAASREGTPTDVEAEARDVGTTADTASGPETDAAEPGDELTPATTEPDEFAPQETIEDRDRESDRRTGDERADEEPVAGDAGRWETAEADPGDPAEPTAEPTEAERDGDAPDASDATEAEEDDGAGDGSSRGDR